jgi:SRSO17 transposase
MLERALAAGVPAGWVTGDEVYGGNPALRGWLERHQMPYVLAIKCTERLCPVGMQASPQMEGRGVLPGQQGVVRPG